MSKNHYVSVCLPHRRNKCFMNGLDYRQKISMTVINLIASLIVLYTDMFIYEILIFIICTGIIQEDSNLWLIAINCVWQTATQTLHSNYNNIKTYNIYICIYLLRLSILCGYYFMYLLYGRYYHDINFLIGHYLVENNAIKWVW